MKRAIFVLLIAVLFLVNPAHAEKDHVERVPIEVFYVAGSASSTAITNSFLPSLKRKYGDKLNVFEHDLSDPKGLQTFVYLQSHYGGKDIHEDSYLSSAPFVFINNRFLYGEEEIQQNLEDEIDTTIEHYRLN